MSVEKTIVWENERWSLTQYFDGIWSLKSKGDFNFESGGIHIQLNDDEIITLQEIIREIRL